MKRFFYLSAILLLFTACNSSNPTATNAPERTKASPNSTTSPASDLPLPFKGNENPSKASPNPVSSPPSEPAIRTAQNSRVDPTLLRVTADQLNRSAPKQIDEETILTGVDVQEDGLLYKFELVSKVAADFDADTRSIVRGVVKERVCNDPSTKANLKDGYSFHYAYVGKDKKPVTKFTIAPKDCGFN